jgi:hypothetical protein
MRENADQWETLVGEFPAAGGIDEQLLFLLNFAIRAPSSHNSQPWLFQLQGHEVDLVADLNRSLPVVDPDNRELIISCGAALNHLTIAARYFGYSSKIEPFPESEYPDLLARFSLGGAREARAEDMLLFAAIPKRHTNRTAFRPDPIPESLLEVLTEYAERSGTWFHLFRDEESRFEVADLVAEADRTQWHDKHFRRELASWLTSNNSDRRDGIPGYAHGIGQLSSEAGAFVVRTFDLGNHRAARDREVAMKSPVLAVLGTSGDNREDWLTIGQVLSTILLRARVEDVWASFLNQAVEVHTTRTKLLQITGRVGAPQLLLRLGFATDVPPTPRRALQDVLLKPRNRAIRLTAENLSIGGQNECS